MHGDNNTAARFAWAVLGYTVFVIVFGAWVRITGSGAGCGQHWPSCHGEILHRPESMETVIELTHRVTSALAGFLSLGVLGIAVAQRRHRPLLWRGAALGVFFMITESLIGAGIVKFELVADDASAARAVGVAVHLVNTALLTAALAWAAWGARWTPANLRAPSSRALWMCLACAVLMLAIMMTGAVTALGDTLFPPAHDASPLEVLAADQTSHAHLLERTRAIHPVVAVVGSLGLMLLYVRIGDREAGARTSRWVRICVAFVLIQISIGVLNIWLSAPGYMQLLHLTIATVAWIAFVRLTLSLFEPLQAHPR